MFCNVASLARCVRTITKSLNGDLDRGTNSPVGWSGWGRQRFLSNAVKNRNKQCVRNPKRGDEITRYVWCASVHMQSHCFLGLWFHTKTRWCSQVLVWILRQTVHCDFQWNLLSEMFTWTSVSEGWVQNAQTDAESRIKWKQHWSYRRNKGIVCAWLLSTSLITGESFLWLFQSRPAHQFGLMIRKSTATVKMSVKGRPHRATRQ